MIQISDAFERPCDYAVPTDFLAMWPKDVCGRLPLWFRLFQESAASMPGHVLTNLFVYSLQEGDVAMNAKTDRIPSALKYQL